MPGRRWWGAVPAGRPIRIRSGVRLPPPPRPAPIRPGQHAAATAGAAFGLLGLLGFVPGLTVHIEDISVAGRAVTTTLLFGLFAVSVLHNVIHLLLGAAGLVLAVSPRAARWYLLAGGAGNLLLAGAGLTPAARGVPGNQPDIWLHPACRARILRLSLLP